MKKHYIKMLSLCLFGALVWTSCTEDDTIEGPKFGGNTSITATIENSEAETRTAVSEDGQVTWIETDAIGVFGGKTQNAKFSSTGKGASVTFNGNLSSAGDEPEWAYYPYDEKASLNGSTLTFDLPSEYTYTGNSDAPMLGIKSATSSSIAFKHLCGLMRITLEELPEDAERFVITSTGRNAPAIAGTATVADIQSTLPILTVESNQSTSITYNLGYLTANNELRHFFIPLPVNTYEKLEVSLYGKDKPEPYFTRTVSNIEIKRAEMVNMPIIDGLTGECYVLSNETIELKAEIAKHVTVSGTDNDVLTFQKEVNEEDIPEVGKIIISKAYESVPYGFLGRVTEAKKNEDGSYVVKTELAGLDEAFDNLYVNVEEDVEINGEQTRILKDDIFGELELNGQLDVKAESPSKALYANGTIEFGGKFEVMFHLNKKEKLSNSYITFTPYIKTDVDLGVQIKTGKIDKDGLKNALGKLKLKPIITASGLVWIYPTIEPYLKLEASGEISNSLHFHSEFKPIVGVEYKDDAWHPFSQDGSIANHEAPWSLNSLNLNGEISIGIQKEINLKLYNKDKLKVYFAPEIAFKLSGELSVNNQNWDSYEKILSDAKVGASAYFSGGLGVAASLLSLNPKDEEKNEGKDNLTAELTIPTYVFWEKEIQILPFFKDLLAKVKSSQKASAKPFEADVNTEMTGEVLSKDMKVELVVADKDGNEIATSEPIQYNGGKTYEEDPDVVVPLENKFTDLQSNSEFQVYPRITSPIFEEVAEGGVIELKGISEDFATHNSIRELLISIYNENGGKDWIHQENWCTDAPVTEWAGVELGEDGYYRFHFLRDRITGTLRITDCDEAIYFPLSPEAIPEDEDVPISEGNYLKEVYLENCTNLKFHDDQIHYSFQCAENIIINNINIENVRIFDRTCSGYEKMVLKELQIKNCKGIKDITVSKSQLDKLILDNLKLEAISMNFYHDTEPGQKTQINNMYIKNSQGEMNLDVFETEISVLDLSNCNMKYTELKNIQVLNVANSSIEFQSANFTDLNVEKSDLFFQYMCLPQLKTLKAENSKFLERTTLWDGANYEENIIKGKEMFEDVFPNIKTIELNNCGGYDMAYNGLSFAECKELQRITLKNTKYSSIDIYSTPSLQYFYCEGGAVKFLSFDEHFNYVNATCINCNELKQEFPSFYNPDAGGNFTHDQYYEYYKEWDDIQDNYVTKWREKGYGWWYPGEPQGGEHSKTN